MFFTRPGNSVVLHALTDESPLIAEAVSKAADKSIFSTGQTSQAWFARRIKNQRTKNQNVRLCCGPACISVCLCVVSRAQRPGVRAAGLNIGHRRPEDLTCHLYILNRRSPLMLSQ